MIYPAFRINCKKTSDYFIAFMKGKVNMVEQNVLLYQNIKIS